MLPIGPSTSAAIMPEENRLTVGSGVSATQPTIHDSTIQVLTTFERGAATVRAELQHQRNRYSSCCSANHGEPTTQYDRWRYHPFSTGHAVRGRLVPPGWSPTTALRESMTEPSVHGSSFPSSHAAGEKKVYGEPTDYLSLRPQSVAVQLTTTQSARGTEREAVDLTSNKRSWHPAST